MSTRAGWERAAWFLALYATALGGFTLAVYGLRAAWRAVYP